MRRLICVFAALTILLGCIVPVFAADGKVIYTEDAGEFIFEPGTVYSPTDLFPDFKDVMPGDSLTQTITVRNDASKKVKIEVFMRSLGAHPDSVEFLSQLKLRVEKSQDNTMAYMFDAYAHEPAQLTDWVCLGTLYSGGEVNLNVILDVPVTLDNEFQELIGYLDWEFRIREHKIDSTDPMPPETGDDADLSWLVLLSAACAMAIVVLVVVYRKNGKGEVKYEA